MADESPTPDGQEDPPPAQVDPPPEAEQPPLGLDEAWERLSSTGRGVVVLLAMALVIGAGVGIGLLVARDDGGGGEQVVLAETASSVVTVEGPPEIETEAEPGTEVAPVPDATETETDFVPVPVPEATETDVVPVPVPEATETEVLPVPVPGETVTEGIPTETGELPGDIPADAAVYTSASPGPDIGAVTVERDSVITWTGGGQRFTLVDRTSGRTLVDSSAVGGRANIEAGQYDLEVTEGGPGWVFAITDS